MSSRNNFDNFDLRKFLFCGQNFMGLERVIPHVADQENNSKVPKQSLQNL
jgi:hypothetical protein